MHITPVMGGGGKNTQKMFLKQNHIPDFFIGHSSTTFKLKALGINNVPLSSAGDYYRVHIWDP